MQIIANENIGAPLIRGQRARGHDVLCVAETMRGADDRAILARAQAERRLVVTMDKDFGTLAFRYGLSAESGVILLRFEGTDLSADTARALAAIDGRSDWTGHFAVIGPERIRLRPLPRSR